MKPPATDIHRKLREKLAELCKSPVAGEAAVARHKLDRLLAKYNFDAKATRMADLFDQVNVRVIEGKARLLFRFDVTESDVASLTQWAIEKSFAVQANVRTDAKWRTAIWVNANAPAMRELQRIAATIREHFVTLWSTFRKSGSVEEADRRPFMLGLYDGMMDDPRLPGQLLPPRAFSNRKRNTKKPAKGVAKNPELSTHPYTLALELGRKIRVCASVSQTTAALEEAIAGALGDRAASPENHPR
jgi:hypothetical protein